MEQFLSYIKFLVKTRIVSPLRSLLLLFAGANIGMSGREGRLLIINLEALGDLVVFTSVLKHYKKRFPHKKIYLLIKHGFGIEEIFKGVFADEVITVDYRMFSTRPFYGARLINSLRKIGFEKVINHDFSAAEINGKYIATSVGAADVVGYEGLGIEFARPFDIQQIKNMRVVMDTLNPRFTKIIQSIDATRGIVQELPGAIRYYVGIYEGATGFAEDNYSTVLPSIEGAAGGRDALRKLGLTAKRYVILGINASVAYKRWPLERFAEVARFYAKKDFDVVLVGSKSEIPLSRQFEELAGMKLMNAVGRTSIHDLVYLVGSAAFVVTNDSSLVHFAVALKTPSLCVIGGGQFGMFSNYGHSNINRWVYKKSPCFGDNWQCGRSVPAGNPSPCITAIETESVLREVETLFEYVKKSAKASSYRAEQFLLGSEFPPKKFEDRKDTFKVLYAGIQSENYNPTRFPSFEYNNFYATLKAMKHVSVVEYPYDPIIGMGKPQFNKKLLQLIRAEKPDIFFAFMFSDELDPRVLDEIKKTTTSIAWFADDQWRLWNYSRHYAPHFTKAVTTWSLAPHAYKQYGITNIIRSQWAANTAVWKPVETKKDIDVSFVGQYNTARAEIIEKLRAAGIDVLVRGWRWPEGRASHEEILKIISRSKINLNLNTPPSRFALKSLARLVLRRSQGRILPSIHFVDNFRSWRNMGTTQIKARPFEVLACRAFMISGYANDMERYYEDGKEIAYYDGSIDDLVKKVRYYIAHDDARDAIARGGYEKTVKEHTYEKRLSEII